MNRIRVALVGVALGALASACGGDSATPDATTATTASDAATTNAADVATATEVDATPNPDALLPDATALAGTLVHQAFGARTGMFSAPIPAADLFVAGRPQLAGWPGATADNFVGTMLALIGDSADGASTAGAIYFPLSASIAAPVADRPLPTVAETTTATSPVFLIDVEPTSPTYLARLPVAVRFNADGGRYGAPNLLSLLPIQGIPMRPATRYAAVVLRSLGGPTSPLGRSDALATLLRGEPLPGLDGDARDTLTAGLATLVRDAHVDPADLAGFTVFRTSAPAAEMHDFVAAALAEPKPDLTGLRLIETYDRFCVFEKDVDLPDYQHGSPPFSDAGAGRWARDAAGHPEVARRAPTRLFVTIPRAPVPTAGFPAVVFIRTGGGGDRPLIDRGLRGAAHGDPVVPHGTGPAMNLAAAGWAGVSWDGPHGGARNPTGGDEQFLMFNVLNPGATRDNVRETALEAIVVRSWLGALVIDAHDCPGVEGAATAVRFDLGQTAIMGHSMGGWVAPLAAAHEPGFKTLLLSGAGGSWIENVVYKQSPLPVAPLAVSILGYDLDDRTLLEDDIALTLLQWAGDASDPQNYGALAMTPPRDVLMIEGIVDTYILPPIANATALSLRLDLAGRAWDAEDTRLEAYTPLGDLLGFVGRGDLPLPVTANRDGRTAVVVQSPGDAIEDGHEALFQTEAPKFQYRCFLADVKAGRVPTVRVGKGEWDACD